MEDPPEPGIDELLASLSRWAVDQRATEAAAARARERWLRQQAGEAATFEGLLVDLAERQAAVVVQGGDRAHVGRLRGVGRDVAVLEGVAGAVTLLAVNAITSIQLAPPETGPPASGCRPATTRLSLGVALAALSAERSTVQLGLRGGQAITGTLLAVGDDVASIRPLAGRAATLYVPIEAITWCALPP